MIFVYTLILYRLMTDLQDTIDNFPSVIQYLQLIEEVRENQKKEKIQKILQDIKCEMDKAIKNNKYSFKYNNSENNLDIYNNNLFRQSIKEASNILKKKGYKIVYFASETCYNIYVPKNVVEDYKNYKPGESGYNKSKSDFEELANI